MVAGVAIGAGWPSLVAFVNIGCYYLVCLPLAAVFGFLASAKRNSLISIKNTIVTSFSHRESSRV
ncbi:protein DETOXIFICATION 33-like [Panicum miliaceum]|uniref:Protein DETOXIFICATION 33-like n=1 Tax=Panicum miliaceum TaxID=4540 RepID=A0A3L6R0M5_PANMI|nr:protein DETOXIFICATION 33-like [Panicum miliaceum]